MDGNAAGEDYEDIDWDTEDELEIENIAPSSCSNGVARNVDAIVSNGVARNVDAIVSNGVARNVDAIISNGEASSSTGASISKQVRDFLAMGFTEQMIDRAIKENGEGNPESILESLLTYGVLEESPDALNSCHVNSPQQQQFVDNGHLSSDYDESILADLSDSDDSWSGGSEIAEISTSLPKHEKAILSLANMGYSAEEASAAVDRCGPEASIAELTDFICAAQMAKAEDVFFEEEKPKISLNGDLKKRKLFELEMRKRKKRMGTTEDDEMIRLPNPMIGFGTPTHGNVLSHRILPEDARAPPYFYYENVALAPKGVWDTISRFLHDVEPEFVDSKYFCAAARKRGYIHNLPIHNRFPLLPLPPRTISDALPLTRRWWPEWDKRTKLNCLQTVIGSAKLTDRIRKALERCGDDDPPPHVQKYVMDECRKWNLVWVGKNKLAPLEPDEVEMLLGFPRNHTRGGGISRTDRYKSLGNSFQVDTVAYHLSVLKDIFPNGINMLSLFSGIGGAEVALHRLGIRLKNVVSVEISEANRDIVRSWWEQTNQRGNLIHLADVTQVNGDRLEQLMASFGGFDLIVGGSPCNNLAGSNRVSRDGLEGEHSSLFFDYFRILDLVKCIMKKQ